MSQTAPADEPRIQDFLLLHFIVFLWGFTAILGKLISIGPLEIVFWRTLIAAGILWVLFGMKTVRELRRGLNIWPVLGTGAFIAVHWYLFFLAARVGNVSSCLAGLATGSVWTALLEPMLARRRVPMIDLISALIVMGGLLIIFLGQADAIQGVLIGIASALFSSLFSIMNRRFMVAKHNPYAISVLGLSGAFLTSAIFFVINNLTLSEFSIHTSVPHRRDWIWLGMLAGACTVFAFTTSVKLLKRFTAFASTLAINMEPVYGILLAVLFFGQRETMQPEFYMGTFLILIAVLGHPIAQRNKARLRRVAATDVLD